MHQLCVFALWLSVKLCLVSITSIVSYMLTPTLYSGITITGASANGSAATADGFIQKWETCAKWSPAATNGESSCQEISPIYELSH